MNNISKIFILSFCIVGYLYGMEGSGPIYKNGQPAQYIAPVTYTEKNDKQTMGVDSKNTMKQKDALHLKKILYDVKELLRRDEQLEEFYVEESDDEKQQNGSVEFASGDAQQAPEIIVYRGAATRDLLKRNLMRNKLQKMVHIYEDPQAAFLRAAKKGDIDALGYFCSQDDSVLDVNVQNKKGNTALMFVSHQGHYEAVQALLERGAAVNKQNNKGRTALFKTYNASVLKLLLGKHAAIDHQDHQGNTALMVAVRAAKYNAIQCLVKHGASKTIKNKIGESVSSVAERLPDEYKRILLQGNSQISLVRIPHFDFKTIMAGVLGLALLFSERIPSDGTSFVALTLGKWHECEPMIGITYKGFFKFLAKNGAIPKS